MTARRRIMIIGAVGAGKTSLIQSLLGRKLQDHKTQALEFYDWLIDTPGEYTENPMFYRSLMATSGEAGLLLMVQDATSDRPFFPFGFSEGFGLPAVGAITKMDHPAANPRRAEGLLRLSLPRGNIYYTSAVTGKGMEALRNCLLGGSDLHDNTTS